MFVWFCLYNLRDLREKVEGIFFVSTSPAAKTRRIDKTRSLFPRNRASRQTLGPFGQISVVQLAVTLRKDNRPCLLLDRTLSQASTSDLIGCEEELRLFPSSADSLTRSLPFSCLSPECKQVDTGKDRKVKICLGRRAPESYERQPRKIPPCP